MHCGHASDGWQGLAQAAHRMLKVTTRSGALQACIVSLYSAPHAPFLSANPTVIIVFLGSCFLDRVSWIVFLGALCPIEKFSGSEEESTLRSCHNYPGTITKGLLAQGLEFVVILPEGQNCRCTVW